MYNYNYDTDNDNTDRKQTPNLFILLIKFQLIITNLYFIYRQPID